MAAAFEHDVGRFDVTVNDPFPVQRRQGRQTLSHDRHSDARFETHCSGPSVRMTSLMYRQRRLLTRPCNKSRHVGDVSCRRSNPSTHSIIMMRIRSRSKKFCTSNKIVVLNQCDAGGNRGDPKHRLVIGAASAYRSGEKTFIATGTVKPSVPRYSVK